MMYPNENRPAGVQSGERQEFNSSINNTASLNFSRYVDKAVSEELEKVTSAGNGERNEALNSAAFSIGQLVGAGAFSFDEAQNLLFSAAISVGLLREESIATIKSGLEAGIKNPRDLSRINSKQGALVHSSDRVSDKKKTPAEIFEEALPVDGTAGQKYLERRGLGDFTDPDAVRFFHEFWCSKIGRKASMLLFACRETPDAPVASIQRVYLDGHGNRLSDGEGNKIPKMALGPTKGCGIWLMQENSSDIIIVAEGPENALPFYLAGYNVVSGISSGNMGNLVIPAGFAKVIIAQDNDASGNNSTRKCAVKFGKQGKQVSVISPDNAGEKDGKPKDWNDILLESGCSVLDRYIGQADEVTTDGLPSGFRTHPKTDWIQHEKIVKGKGDEPDTVTFYNVCSPVEFTAHTQDMDKKNHGLAIRVKTRAGHWNELVFSNELLARSTGEELIKILLYLGLRLGASNQAAGRLIVLFRSIQIYENAVCVDRVGWHGEHFILPDASFPARGDRIFFQPKGAHASIASKFTTEGSLQTWQQSISQYAVGNSRLIFAISLAFGAPLLKIVNEESGVIHLRGGSSMGKTTALRVAGSVCGGGGVQGYCSTWRATDNALEGMAASHCDALLCLDELGQVSPEAAAESSYMLANGQGKQRANKSGMAQSVAEWRLLGLSTGEISLADKIRQSKRPQRIMAGQQVRFIDLPADAGEGAGVFENTHGFDPAEFAMMLNDNSNAIYGTALRAFLERLVKQDFDVFRFQIAEQKKNFVDAVADGMDGQVKRVAGRFGLIAAAGELATLWGVTGWPEGVAHEAAQRLFFDWLGGRGTTGPSEMSEGIKQIISFLETHGVSRFTPWHDADKTVLYRVGFVQKSYREYDGQGQIVKLGPDEPVYYIFPDAWKNTVCKGYDAPMLARELRRRGVLDADPDGKNLARKICLPDGSRLRVYVLTPGKLGGTDE